MLDICYSGSGRQRNVSRRKVRSLTTLILEEFGESFQQNISSYCGLGSWRIEADGLLLRILIPESGCDMPNSTASAFSRKLCTAELSQQYNREQ